MIKLVLFVISILFYSCGFEPQEKRDQAVLTANIQLSSRNCDEALSALEAAPFSWKDSTFLRTLSLAYACDGNFDVVKLFSDDLPLFGAVANSPLGGLTQFSTSTDMESPTDKDYTSLSKALNYLLYAGGISSDEDPTPAKREAIFAEQDLQEIEMLAFYELLVNLGRFLHYYGNTDEDGAKGAGDQSNKCFIVYDNLVLENGGGATIKDFFNGAIPGVGNVTGSCTRARSNDSGHEYLYDPVAGTRNISRLCEGAVLINNFFILLPRVLASLAGSDFDDVDAISAVLTVQLDIVEVFKSGIKEKVGNILSHDLCISNNENDDSYLQFYYAFIVEVLLK